MAYSCVICGGSKSKKIKEGVRDNQDYFVVECEHCRHQQLDPLPGIEECQEYYDNDMQMKSIYGNVDIEFLKKRTAFDVERQMGFLRNTINHRLPVIEIGTGYGFFMQQMEQDGYNIHGIEISKSRRNIADKLCRGEIFGFNLITDVIPHGMKSKYHAVLLFQVLEHISQPVTFISKLKELLCDDGLLILEIPNLNDHLLDFCDEYKDFFYQVAHISYFTPHTINLLLRNAGFSDVKIIGIQRYSVDNLMNWLTKGKPQIMNPSHEARKELEWLDTYYRKYLSDELKTDTLMVVAR